MLLLSNDIQPPPACLNCNLHLNPTQPPTPVQLVRIMEEVEKLLHWLSNVLDGRVFVALCRGLWDLTSKDVLVGGGRGGCVPAPHATCELVGGTAARELLVHGCFVLPSPPAPFRTTPRTCARATAAVRSG